MNENVKLFRALSYVDAGLTAEAEEYRPTKNRQWTRWAAAAAALVLTVGIGAAAVRFSRRDITVPGSETPGGEAPGGTQGHVPDPGLGTYDGPVLPLAVSEGGLSARREVTVDLDGFHASWPYTFLVTDGYTLTNPGDSPVAVTAYYPFVGTLAAPGIPKITVDGENVDPALRTGPYPGSFREEQSPALLRELGSFEEYRALLSTVPWQDADGADDPVFGLPATVYELRGVTFTDPDRYAVVEASFGYGEGVTVFTLGFSGDAFRVEEEGNHRTFGVWSSDEHSRYIIAVGGDITGLAARGWRDATLAEPYGVEITEIVRFETTLGEILDRLAAEYAQADPETGPDLYFGAPISPELGAENLARELRRSFALYSPLGAHPSARYRWEPLERLLRDTLLVRRVMWLEFPVTVPAGGSVHVEGRTVKAASTAYSPAAGGAVSRLDVAGTLGSNLAFTSAALTLVNAEGAELLDPDNYALPLAPTPSPAAIGEVYSLAVMS